MVGKLILQHVLGVHKDKILYDEDAAMFPEYVKDVFGHIGIPFNDDVWNQLWTTWQDKTLTAIMRYIFDHSKRPVYLSAHDMWQYIIGEGLPDELKACLYNEGLTMRYSAKPYDNRAVKRRNIEQRGFGRGRLLRHELYATTARPTALLQEAQQGALSVALRHLPRCHQPVGEEELRRR